MPSEMAMRAVWQIMGAFSLEHLHTQEARERRMAEIIDAEYAPLRALAGELAEALRELQAMVRGECPSLLNEDSGGCARLDITIDSTLEKAAEGLIPAENANEDAWVRQKAAEEDGVMVSARSELSDSERPAFREEAWEVARKVAEIDKQLLSTQAVEAFAELARNAYDAAIRAGKEKVAAMEVNDGE